MSKCLLFLALVAVASAFTNTRDELREAVLKLQSLHTQPPPRMIPAPMHLQAGNATACFEAWVQLNTLLNGTCGAITALYQPNLVGVNVAGLVNAQCVVPDQNGLTCDQKVTLAIHQFSLQCSGTGMVTMDAVTRAQLNLWLTVAKVPCLTYSNTLCFPVFRTNLDAFITALNNSVPLTPALLNTVCIPCVELVLDTLASWGIKDFVSTSSALKIACTQRNGTYCMPIFIAATQNLTNLNTTAQLDLACNDCTRLIAYRLYFANLLLGAAANMTQRADLQTYLGLAGYICQRNEINEYCAAKLSTYDYSGVALSCAVLPPSGCPGSTCQTQLLAFKNATGCCFGTWFNYLKWYYTVNATAYLAQFHGVTPSALQTFVSSVCQVSVPQSCATKKLKLDLKVYNILIDWYTTRKAWIEDRVHDVIAYILHIDAAIVVDIWSEYDNVNLAVIVHVSILGWTDADVDRYNLYIADIIQVSNDANSVIAGVKDDGNGSQTATIENPITVSAQSYPVCNTTSCNLASTLAPSFSLFLLLALLLAYFD